MWQKAVNAWVSYYNVSNKQQYKYYTKFFTTGTYWAWSAVSSLRARTLALSAVTSSALSAITPWGISFTEALALSAVTSCFTEAFALSAITSSGVRSMSVMSL